MSTPIDAHAHLFTRSEGLTLGKSLTLEHVLLRDLKRELDACEVAGAVVLPVGLTDDYVASCLATEPSRLRAVIVHDRPSAPPPRNVVQRMRACGADGLRMFGLGAGGHRLRERTDFPLLKALANAQMILWLYAEEHDYAAVAELVTELPELTVVLNHLGFPWASRSTDGAAVSLEGCLASAENGRCFVTVSGQWAFSAGGYPFADLHPRVRTLYAAFGAGRLLWASDYPGCLAACTYAEQLAVLDDHLPDLDPVERQRIRGDNARELFGFDDGGAER